MYFKEVDDAVDVSWVGWIGELGWVELGWVDGSAPLSI